MQFELDADQTALQESLRRFFSREYDFELRRGFLASPHGTSASIWQSLAEQGALAIAIPEEHGGFGGPVETMLVMEEIGRALVLEPYLSTVVLCASLLAARGRPEQQAEWLGRIAAGNCKLALAHSEPDARYELHFIGTKARASGDHYLLNGVKSTVLDGAVADCFLVSARLQPRAEVAVFLVDAQAAGLERVSYRTQDGRTAADLTLRDVKVPRTNLLGDESHAMASIERSVERGIAALCAEAVGAIEAVNHATLEYTKSRKQFGQPIARFQALQHRMADMFVLATQARSMALLATGRCNTEDAAVRRHDISAAKAFIGKAARFVGQQAVQLHGGMGIADELSVSHYFKRLTMIGVTFGDIDHHVATISNAILAEGQVS
ncbi:MAG TPA: acyl-CoA dehydrogenase family protein [Steroidobacteraceae bacterium]|jgi:alkylation response protein AidB-like acyl-CoA dehydrogenase